MNNEARAINTTIETNKIVNTLNSLPENVNIYHEVEEIRDTV